MSEGPDTTLGEPFLGGCGAFQLLGAKLEPPSHEQNLGGVLWLQRRGALFGCSVHGFDRLVDFPPFALSRRVWKFASEASSSDEVETGIARETGHAVEKRETLDAPSKRRQLLLEGLEALESVPKPAGVLEVEAGYGDLHAGLECGKRFASATLEEAPRGRHLLLISCAAHACATRRQACAQLGPHAEGSPSLGEDIQLIVEENRRRAGTIPETEDVSQFANRVAHVSDGWEGSEVERAVGNSARDRQDPGCDFLGEFHEGVHPLPLVLHVETGLPALNQLHLTDQRREFVRNVLPPNPAGLSDQFGRFLSRRGPEVREESCAHADRLSHVQWVSVVTQHLINARTVFGMSPHIFAEGGGGHVR